MEILKISEYGNTQYNEILNEFQRFKKVILNLLSNFEDIIIEVIDYHTKFTSISPEYYDFIEKEFKLRDFVNSIQKKYTIKNNHLKYNGIQSDLNQMKIELQNIYSQQFLPSIILSLKDQVHHKEIEIINKNEIRRSQLSNGRWLIQTIKFPEQKNNLYRSKQIQFTINGSDIIFGVASYAQIEKHCFELQYQIPGSYFVRQDGVHFGFGLTEAQQDFSQPEFSSKKGHKISMILQTVQNVLIIENLITKAKEEYEIQYKSLILNAIPQLSNDWCYIFGLRYQNDSIVLEL